MIQFISTFTPQTQFYRQIDHTHTSIPLGFGHNNAMIIGNQPIQRWHFLVCHKSRDTECQGDGNRARKTNLR